MDEQLKQIAFEHRLDCDFYIDNMELDHGTSMPYFHYHDLYELFYVRRGHKRYIINGISYDLSAHEFALISPRDVHRSVSLDNLPQSRLILYFSREYFVRWQDIIERRHARLLFKGMAEMVVRVSRKFRQIIQIDVRGVLLVDIAQHGGEAVLLKGGFRLADQAEKQLPCQQGTHKMKVDFFIGRLVLNLFQNFKYRLIVVAV